MKKIGIYGGSFDPIHLGHLNLAVEIMEAHHLDEVWFCPNAANPLKESPMCTSAFHRLNMIRLAIENEPRFLVSEIEINRKSPSYTLDTLKEFHRLGSNHVFYLILGEDSARNFHQWHEPEAILDLAQLLIGRRSDKDQNIGPFLGSDKIINAINQGMTSTRVMDISSTEIRQRLLNKNYCYHLLPGKVMDYIITNHLYYPTLKARFL